jgi:hypothetical protein
MVHKGIVLPSGEGIEPAKNWVKIVQSPWRRRSAVEGNKTPLPDETRRRPANPPNRHCVGHTMDRRSRLRSHVPPTHHCPNDPGYTTWQDGIMECLISMTDILQWQKSSK